MHTITATNIECTQNLTHECSKTTGTIAQAILHSGFFLSTESRRYFRNFFLFPGSDKIWYQPNFFYLFCFYTDNPKSTTRQSNTYNDLFLFWFVNQWCLIS
jgi:hypothetical protein